MFENFLLISSDCSLIFFAFAFAFARCEHALSSYHCTDKTLALGKQFLVIHWDLLTTSNLIYEDEFALHEILVVNELFNIADPMEFSRNVFNWIQQIQWQKYLSLKRLETATFSVWDRDASTSTEPARHIWETGSLNWAKFMVQRFIKFAEFNENSAPFRKTSNNTCFCRKMFLL